MKKGEIWLVELYSVIGHEQSGLRPALVLADTITNIAIVLPFTSNLQSLRFPHTLEVKPSKDNGLSAISILLVFHIRALDKIRFKRKIGVLEDPILKEVDTVFKRLVTL